MKQHRLVLTFITLIAVWVLNISLKCYSAGWVNKLKLQSSIDTLIKSKIALYADTNLYSGYLGNLEPVRNQILNKKRIDSLLNTPVPYYYALTEKDKKLYTLRIDQKSIKRPSDTIIYGKKYKATHLPLKFANYSNDTLKYISMDCSWLDYYFTSNKHIEFEKQYCFKNESFLRIIPPHLTVTVYIPILFNKDYDALHKKFRIGMSLQKCLSCYQYPGFQPFLFFLRPETSNMIWSNEVYLL